ncbi:alkane 1-monooxygenase [Pseudomonas sp. N040]|uniref:alkane 1-monooxygenase n=1 Tax=Pseudomonas sp. N040 TaxID=2785325 RepID=UPI0018A2C127|nr:alkane 1-monooxygenase [Pseudomonas sp. N040]MBF7731564.1 alkane 1-monooxygenase [Pseudomonas sp. N040]MBW7015208.1 alkane 1-monooxygenase [Pseudomonas sp. N040]
MKLLHYLKYFIFHAVGLFTVASILAGGDLTVYGMLMVFAFYILGDVLLGDDTSIPDFGHPMILTLQLWLALPLLTLVMFTMVWSVCSGDPLGYGALVTQLTGYDVLAARETISTTGYALMMLLSGLLIAIMGTATGHELTHRTWDPVSMLIGRWLLAYSFDTGFAVEHVYGHHRYVSTVNDPATAPRGRNVYSHIISSGIKSNIGAWNLERERLARRGLPVFSYHNNVIRGHLMSVALLVAAYLMGGWLAVVFFTVCGLWGKAILEIVNYMEHYGMVRDPATPVQPRHSWNTNKRITSWSMFNLSRHSHHHAQGEVPFHELQPYPDAPMMIGGYVSTLSVALIPPLWFRLMEPKLRDWDERYATAEERVLAAEADARAELRSSWA